MRYLEVKSRQKYDMENRKIDINIYRIFSSYFTYIFVNLRIHPNYITLLSTLSCIVGMFVMIYDFLIGIVFFILFKILDDSDGETARLLEKCSPQGQFLDRFSHYIFDFCLGIGIFFSTYIGLGLVLMFVLIISDFINDNRLKYKIDYITKPFHERNIVEKIFKLSLSPYFMILTLTALYLFDVLVMAWYIFYLCIVKIFQIIRVILFILEKTKREEEIKDFYNRHPTLTQL